MTSKSQSVHKNNCFHGQIDVNVVSAHKKGSISGQEGVFACFLHRNRPFDGDVRIIRTIRSNYIQKDISYLHNQTNMEPPYTH